MKKTIIFICIACVALFVSCTKAELPSAGRLLTVTLSSDQISKTDISGSAGSYTREWSKGDKISVIYYVESVAKNECFELVDGEGTTTGTFACSSSEITEDQYVRFLYPYTTETNAAGTYWKRSIAEQYSGSKSNMGDYDLMYGTGKFTSGAFNVTSGFNSQVFYLHFPAGLQLASGRSGQEIVELTLSATGTTTLNNAIINNKTVTTASTTAGKINLSSVYLYDGAIQYEAFMAINTDGIEDETFQLEVKYGEDTCTYDISHSGYLYNGRIYHMTQAKIGSAKALE